MEQFLQQLHEMELFGKIEKGQIGAMLQCLGAVAKDYAKGEFIFLEGESLDSVGVVMSGSVQTVSYTHLDVYKRQFQGKDHGRIKKPDETGAKDSSHIKGWGGDRGFH